MLGSCLACVAHMHGMRALLPSAEKTPWWLVVVGSAARLEHSLSNSNTSPSWRQKNKQRTMPQGPLTRAALLVALAEVPHCQPYAAAGTAAVAAALASLCMLRISSSCVWVVGALIVLVLDVVDAGQGALLLQVGVALEPPAVLVVPALVGIVAVVVAWGRHEGR